MDKTIDVHNGGREKFFFNNVVKFDIDLNDLEGLIEYRSALANRNRSGLSIDRMIQVELS